MELALVHAPNQETFRNREILAEYALSHLSARITFDARTTRFVLSVPDSCRNMN
jgi:hypothetical protein